MTNQHPIISFEQSRRVDQVAIEQYGMSGLVLMENAGSGVARRLASAHPGARFAILCGRGNNGGDGYVIARHLDLLDCHVKVLTASSPDALSGDARVNAKIAALAGLPMECFADQTVEGMLQQLSDCDVIVDCLLGTGSVGTVRDPFRSLIDIANRCPAIRVAVDVPSGWPAVENTTDAVAFEATKTMTFVAAKTGMEKENADRWIGVLEIVAIGVPKRLLEQLQIPTE